MTNADIVRRIKKAGSSLAMAFEGEAFPRLRLHGPFAHGGSGAARPEFVPPAPTDISAIRKVVRVPIIGILKASGGWWCAITGSFESAEELAPAAQYHRARLHRQGQRYGALERLEGIRRERCTVMADIATVEEASRSGRRG